MKMYRLTQRALQTSATTIAAFSATTVTFTTFTAGLIGRLETKVFKINIFSMNHWNLLGD